jgi:hypothetical protein
MDLVSSRVSMRLTLGVLVATFLLTRQSQIPALEGFAAAWALLLLAMHGRLSPNLALLLPILIYGLASVLASLSAGREAAAAFRFFTITLATLFAFHIKPRPIAVPLALLPVTVQALLITAISIGLTALQDPAVDTAVRGYAQGTNWGDIYSFDGLYYRVQVVGNALVPLLFMISIWRWHVGVTYKGLAVVSALGLAAAGNLTYFIVAVVAVMLAHGWRLRRSAGARVGFVLTAALVAIASWGTVDDVVSNKFEGSDSSMGVRFDQLIAAERSIRDDPGKLLFGSGLGARFPDGQQRNYSEENYIEMQWLHLALQLGVVGSLLYGATLWLSVRLLLSSSGRQIFWLYMLAGCTNPYILDTNQIIATVILVATFPRSRAPPADRVGDRRPIVSLTARPS